MKSTWVLAAVAAIAFVACGTGSNTRNDINECKTNNGGCDSLTTCTEVEGGEPTCGDCPGPYWTGNGGDVGGCTNVLECATSNGGCDALTTCTEVEGGEPTCGDCPGPYWKGNGGDVGGCTDVLECATSNGGCNALTTCTEVEGGEPTCGDLPLPDGFLSRGQLNAYKKSLQFTDLTWTPIRPIPKSSGGYFEPGVEVTGMLYSSTRVTPKYVGFEVSLETFMTALKNPASVIYTRNLKDPSDPDYNPYVTNIGPYYGMVCSSFTSYVLGLQLRTFTAWWDDIEGQTALAVQAADECRTGDTLLTDGHVQFVEFVERDADENIVQIIVNEMWQPTARRTSFSEEEFNQMLTAQGYTIYRYDYAGKNLEYEQSPFVTVFDETPLAPYVYNEVIGIDYGNKSLYPLGTNVEVNVMERSLADVLTIQRLNSEGWVDVDAIAVGDIAPTTIDSEEYFIHSFSPTEAGSYRAYCAMNDGSDSDPLLWDVGEIHADVPEVGVKNEDVIVDFSCSSNLRPLYLAWAGPGGGDIKRKLLTASEISAGSVSTSYHSNTSQRYLRVYFQGQHGVIATPLQEIVLSSPGP